MFLSLIRRRDDGVVIVQVGVYCSFVTECELMNERPAKLVPSVRF